MGIKEKVLDLLKESKKGITVKNISKVLNIRENAVNMYITRLKKENKITKRDIIGKKNRYIIYSVKENIINLEEIKEGFMQYYKLFKVIIDNAEQIIKDTEYFKQLIKENVNIPFLEEIESKLGIKSQ